MKQPARRLVACSMLVACLMAGIAASPARQKPLPPMARVLWLEPDAAAPPAEEKLPMFREIPATDPRVKDFERWIDTEPGRLARRMVYVASKRFGVDADFAEPVLPIVVRKDGNNGARGLAIRTQNGVLRHPSLAYVILDPNPDYLGNTILHESAHVVHTIASRGRRDGSAWSAFPHTTFAVSDAVTALSEGYAIHLETMTGHFAMDAERQDYYHRWSPSFEAGKGRKAAFFLPIDDLMNFAQVWARYQSVRDMTPGFEGHLYPGDYARSQMDPARDLSRLKNPNAMLASEGVAASVIFWIAAELSAENGAVPGGGLDQPGIVEAETVLMDAMAGLPYSDAPPFRPDLLDLVESLAHLGEHAGDVAVSRFVDVTRGVTAKPAIRSEWSALYRNAIDLDLVQAKAQVATMDAERGDIVVRARKDIGTLRAGVGPVIPVQLKDAVFELKAFGQKSTVKFDLNAMSIAEITLIRSLDSEKARRIEAERESAPFASLADFERRTGVRAADAGLVEIPPRR